ncbi:MAG: CPXCG motif-containing cysteine-rich protein [Gammaproteobacteria bacterium]|nr:CPXCG motif-containing cysteine-rich protein [Gammaproteobacteria bacterium]TVQ48687.1 MAG: CPXCG motif-containing cysteine-rich protein [Gammaproteobacteria bacterium]
MSLQSARVQCPYCWEMIEVVADCSVPEQEYIEDCSVCCRPIVMTVICEDGELLELAVRSEDQ